MIQARPQSNMARDELYTSLVMLYTTLPDTSAAEKLAKILLKKTLVGCVTILPKVTSLYAWKGEIKQEKETLLLAKSCATKIPSLRACVEQYHPYDVPAILFLPIHANNAYQKWLTEVTG